MMENGNNYDELNRVFFDTINMFKTKYPELFNKGLKEHIFKLLIKYTGKYHINVINYDKNYLTFNKNYFIKNLYKSMISMFYLQENNLLNTVDILDIGCGAGPASLGYLLVKSLNSTDYRDLNITIVDTSVGQLDLAFKILDCLKIKNINSIRKKFIISDQILDELVLFSYFICEQDSKYINILSNHVKNFKKGFICIDYEKNIRKLERLLKHKYEFTSWNLKVKVEKDILNLLQEEYIYVHGCYCEP
jgi:SAM-dependent methyltransferase